MPRLTIDMETHQLGGQFTYQGARIDRLGAAEYTLVTVAVDETGSVHRFADELRKMLMIAVAACKKSSRTDNLLVRVLTFSDKYPNGVNEVHGFKPLADIDVNAYPRLRPGGMTPLCDACYSSIGSMNSYGKQLKDQDFNVNGIGFVVTDGGENASTATMRMVKEEAVKAVTGELLESMVTVLVGINVAECTAELSEFQKDAGMSQYVDAGEATERKLAKLAEFVSSSVSSQSQALGTGGPSQNIAAKI